MITGVDGADGVVVTTITTTTMITNRTKGIRGSTVKWTIPRPRHITLVAVGAGERHIVVIMTIMTKTCPQQVLVADIVDVTEATTASEVMAAMVVSVVVAAILTEAILTSSSLASVLVLSSVSNL